MDNVRFAVIGVGNMGTHHAKYLSAGEVAGASLAAVCDIDPARGAWMDAHLPASVKRYADTAALFAAGGFDAVLIATPHYDHPTLAIEAFGRGLHVLSEKPAGVCVKQVRAMNAAAERSGKVFGIMYNQRTHADHRKMRELIAQGELGTLRRLSWLVTDWFRSQAYYDSGGWRATWAGEGGGVLLNQCPHNLDLFQWIPDLMPKRVRAFCRFGHYHDIEVEDDVTAYLEYENGATGVFITTTGEAPGTNRLEIVGDRGKLLLEGGRLLFFRNRVPMNEYLRTSKDGFSQPECWRVEVPTPGESLAHIGITRNFVAAIRTGSPLLSPGVEGIRGLTISNAMHLSAWTDRWVDLPMDEEAFDAAMREKIAASRYKKPKPAQSSAPVSDMSSTF